MITYLYTQQANNLVDDSLNSVFYEPWQTKCWEAWQHKRRKSNLTSAWEVRKASQWRWLSKPRSKSLVGELRKEHKSLCRIFIIISYSFLSPIHVYWLDWITIFIHLYWEMGKQSWSAHHISRNFWNWRVSQEKKNGCQLRCQKFKACS